MFDYIASGLPVVSTRLAEYDDYKEFVKTSDTADGFISLIESELKNDSQKLIKKRVNTAKAFLWSNRVDDMLKIIKEKINEK